MMGAFAIKTRADLFRMPEFANLDGDTRGNPCVWRNEYTCDECQADAWDNEWSCQCDDECPVCGADCSPSNSVWIGPNDAKLRDLWENLPEEGEA
jgi:hypothetical protein